MSCHLLCKQFLLSFISIKFKFNSDSNYDTLQAEILSTDALVAMTGELNLEEIDQWPISDSDHPVSGWLEYDEV